MAVRTVINAPTFSSPGKLFPIELPVDLDTPLGKVVQGTSTPLNHAISSLFFNAMATKKSTPATMPQVARAFFVEMGKLGAAKRFAGLSKEEVSAINRKASLIRWSRKRNDANRSRWWRTN